MNASVLLTLATKKVSDLGFKALEIIGEYKRGQYYYYITDGKRVCKMEIIYDCVVFSLIDKEGYMSLLKQYITTVEEISKMKLLKLLNASITFDEFIHSREMFKGYHYIKPEVFSNDKKPKLIKGTYRFGNHFEYEIRGKRFKFNGDVYYNKRRNRLEHEHIGERGGKYLVYWNF